MRNHHLTFALIFCLLLASSHAIAQQGRSRTRGSSSQSAMTSILQSLDTNRNGMLDSGEANGRTREFVRQAGLDPKRTHSIAAIAKALEKKNKEGKKGKTTSSAASSNGSARKVTGFGVETEKFGVKDFSPSGEERMSVEAMNRRFGESVIAQVDRAMTRYDSDKNGLIDPVEQKRTRWTSPSADVSDTNKDGSLSRLELAYRYQQRAEETSKRVATKNVVSTRASLATKSKQTTSSSRTTYSSTGRSSRSSRSPRGGASSRYSRGSNPSNSSKTASSTGKRFDSTKSDAYRKYVDGLFKNYDENKDGRLNKDELGEMRRPPKDADANKDGFVDKNELIASVSKKSGGGDSGSSAKSSVSTKASKALDSKRRKPSKTYNAADSIFGGKDTNSDGQLQMSEFAEEWTNDLVQEFRGKDFNNDGVITEKEWQK